MSIHIHMHMDDIILNSSLKIIVRVQADSVYIGAKSYLCTSYVEKNE